MKSPIERARAYLTKVPPAISGQNGSAAAYGAACRMREFDLSFEDALALLAEWNQNCKPPWTESELRHKLTDAFKRTQPKQQFMCPRRNTFPPPVRKATCGSLTPAASSAPTIPAVDLRGYDLHEGTESDIMNLAMQRLVSKSAVRLMERRGQLRFGRYFWERVWFTTDMARRIAIARRMDGERWKLQDRSEVKALNVRGSIAAWPIGVLESRNFPCIALVEGSGDALAGHDFILREKRERDCAIVTMASASPLIHSEALQHFKGKRVRIFTHADTNGTGEKAGDKWRAQLESVGAILSLYHCGIAGCKDMNDLARAVGFYETILP